MFNVRNSLDVNDVRPELKIRRTALSNDEGSRRPGSIFPFIELSLDRDLHGPQGPTSLALADGRLPNWRVRRRCGRPVQSSKGPTRSTSRLASRSYGSYGVITYPGDA